MTQIIINLDSRNISETPLRTIFADAGQRDLSQCVAETIAAVGEGTNTRWCLSKLDNRPIKWAVIERSSDQVYLYFCKDDIDGSNPAPIPAKSLFDVDDLSMMADIYLGDKKAPFAAPEYKEKVMGPLSDEQAATILNIMCLRNFDLELRNEIKGLARNLTR
ncbi:MAG TPA: hypothetical protein EYG18_05375 [Micavibrio sp.]|nr:hypothetical protein [Micavibrio sp.]HIL28680.1 hypothetical protein [Micavibrio sp.]